MANEQNLRPFNQMSAEEHRKIAQKGGRACAQARRERKALRDELTALLGKGKTQEKICAALVEQAEAGNLKAFEILRDTIGEKPVNSVSVAGRINTPFDGLSEEDLREIARQGREAREKQDTVE